MIGTFTTARDSHTATLLTNGRVLVTGGTDYYYEYSVSEIYDLTSKSWTFVGNLNSARDGHTATLLTNGQVLVTGGYGVAGYLKSAELYNPLTSTWTTTGTLNIARQYHTATLLTNSQVLVVGGHGSSIGYLSSAELFNPVAGTWTKTGALNTGREYHTAILLNDGRVLVAGGYGSGGYLNSAELYDPVTGTWTTTGSLNTARQYHTATLLTNGQVLVAGGFYGSFGDVTNTEVYNPAVGTWAFAGALGTGRRQHTATLLPNGKVLLAGGGAFLNGGIGPPAGFDFKSSAELFDVSQKATAIITLSNLKQTYDGTANNVTATTTPIGLTVELTYNDSPVAPTNVGSYIVIGIITDLNYQGCVTNNLSISLPTFALSSATLANGVFSLSFTNVPGTSFTVLTTTNLTLPLTNWEVLGSVEEVSSGKFQFTDQSATNGGQRFYQVRSP